MDRLLNEQEMKAISKVCNSRSCKTCTENSYGADYCGYEVKVAKSQLAKADADWVKWIEEPCYEHPIGDYEHDCKCEHFTFVDSQVDAYEHWHYAHRKDCPVCWQERKKELVA
jgi:hypothetical protein